MSRPVRVLLLWPGTDGAAAGNFGVPQLVLLATHLRARTGAQVTIRDLVAEAAFGRVSLERLLDGDDGRGYDVIGFSVYSSFDWLKCEALAEIARERWPQAVLVAGGYHASARPTEIVRDGSPFDVCVVGEGERPLVRVVESVAGGAPLRNAILGPEAVDHLAELPPSDWSFLERYRPVARRVASQAQVYFSRGCPFDCAFCMERAKREVSWRPLPVERAVEEIRSLHRWLDLSGWTVYVADALFGMRKSWRRELLEALARERIPASKIWMLIRIDLVEDEDLRLFADANCSLGFGLESGDPAQLATIRKAGRLDTYLERMTEVAAWARERNVPWGANVICGHPGETPGTMERSARYLRELFLDPKGVTGFLSVDPFRLYPGSPIDAERASWESRYGTRFHRPDWWHDGDPEFLSEWVDPSSELDWLERERLQHETLGPILAGLEGNFVYDGPARDYFLRAIRQQVDVSGPRTRVHFLDRYYAWLRYLGFGSRADALRRRHGALTEVARSVRRSVMPKIGERARVAPDDPVLAALERVPREVFVPVDQVAEGIRDRAVAVDGSGEASVSAMHAYARAFSLLGVAQGDRVMDLGAGTGYGTAILSELVGEGGRVLAVELDPALVDAAEKNLTGRANVRIAQGDALDAASWRGRASKAYAGFALPELPERFAQALGEGGVLVAPLVEGQDQRLVRATVRGGRFEVERFETVLYVGARREPPGPKERGARFEERRRGVTRLPVV